MSIQKLTQIAKDMTVAAQRACASRSLIFQILKAQTELSGFIFSEGVASKSCPDGFGLPARSDYNYLPGPDDIYVSPSKDPEVRSCRPATRCRARFRPPKEGERYFALIKVEAVNFERPIRRARKLFSRT
jgi:transcription termination factor Rho